MKKKLMIGIILIAVIISCAEWEDAKKDWESDTEGLKRKVEVYTLDGKLIKEYKGLIRVRSTEESNLVSLNLVNEKNKRVMIENAIVVIEEEE